MKRAIVTGANSGIGKATALGLAKDGMEVILVCRDSVKGDAACKEIIEESGNKNIHIMIADFSSQKSIRKFAKDFLKKYKHLNVLVNNAGVSLDKMKMTEEGIEWVFAVNHLGYFLLTTLLLDLLKKSAPSRVVNVASGVHYPMKLDFSDLQLTKKWKSYKAYANSKLANVYFTYELARRLDGTGVTVNCLSPGLVKSELFRYQKLPLVFRIIKKLIGKTTEQGAETPIYLATSPTVEGVTGKYFESRKAKKSSKISYDEEIAKKLWTVSEELCDL